MTEADTNYFAAEYRRTDFCGGLNWHRNIERNWELLAPWEGATIRQPALFIAGKNDPVIGFPAAQAEIKQISTTVPGIRRVVLITDSSHWIQQERATEVNAALVEFLRGL